jgi:SAM-dependent methyltransferase
MIKRWARDFLDQLGLIARAYDVRARVKYAFDRQTQASNSRFRASPAPDGLPLPPPELVYRVAGHFNLEWFYESGVEHARLLKDVLAASGVDSADIGALLDFGCGCGRVIRHWADGTSKEIHGTDYNPRLVEWCRRSLGFAEFGTNRLEPPLRYRDGQFNFVYAISVFTHLTEDLQHAWMRELERILAPSGVLLITTKGRSRLESLGPAERTRFERGELVVQEGRYAGRNLCAAFHPERYVREQLAGALEVLDVVPAAAGGAQTQDVFVLRRPA